MKNRHIGIRVTEKEHSLVQAAADSKNMPLAHYVRNQLGLSNRYMGMEVKADPVVPEGNVAIAPPETKRDKEDKEELNAGPSDAEIEAQAKILVRQRNMEINAARIVARKSLEGK